MPSCDEPGRVHGRPTRPARPPSASTAPSCERWLRNPPADAAHGRRRPNADGRIRGMPNLGLTEQQIDQLVAYLSTPEVGARIAMAIIEQPPTTAGARPRPVSSRRASRSASSRRPDRHDRLEELGLHRRPQEDRHHVRRRRAGVLPHRRLRGAADPRSSWPGPTARCCRPSTYNQVFTMHGTTMVFLVRDADRRPRSPTTSMPLQIGARDVAFPRINAFSFWASCSAASSSTSAGSSAARPTAAGSPTPRTPAPLFSPSHGIDFWTLGLLITGIASLTGADQPDRHRAQHAGARA